MLKAKAVDIKLEIVGASIVWATGLRLIAIAVMLLLGWRGGGDQLLGSLISFGLTLVYPLILHTIVARRTGVRYRVGYAYFACIPVYTVLILSSMSEEITSIVIGSLVIALEFVVFDLVFEHWLKTERTSHFAIWQRLDQLSFRDYVTLGIPRLKAFG